MKRWKLTRKTDEKMNNFDETMENYSKKTDEEMDKILQTMTD